MCARALAVHALARARGAGRDGLAALGVLGGSAAKWTNVVWSIKRGQTNQQTHTTLDKYYGVNVYLKPCPLTRFAKR